MVFSVYLHNRLWYGMLKVIKQIKNEYLTGPLYLAYNTHGKDKIRTYLQYRRRSVYNQGDTWGIGITAKYRHNTSTRVDGNWRTGGTRREIEREIDEPEIDRQHHLRRSTREKRGQCDMIHTQWVKER